MKKALIVTGRRVFPIRAGDQVRIFNISKYLDNKGYKVDCLALSDKNAKTKKEPFNKYIEIGHSTKYSKVIKQLFKVEPLQCAYFKNKSMEKKYKTIKNEYDVIVFHLIRTSYLETSDNSLNILELTDDISFNYKSALKKDISLFWKIIYHYEIFTFKKYYKKRLNKYDKISVITETDKAKIEDHTGNMDSIHIYKNGVNIKQDLKEYDKVDNSIAFFGNMRTVANKHAFDKLLDVIQPLYEERYGKLNVILIGKNSDKHYRDRENFKVIGEVEDPIAELSKYQVGYGVLEISAGMQNKVLDYINAGLPVVLNSRINKFGLTDGINCKIANAPSDIVDAIHYLHSNDNKSLAQNAKQHIQSKFDWSKVLDGYEKEHNFVSV